MPALLFFVSFCLISPLNAVHNEEENPAAQFDELYDQVENQEVDISTINRLVFFLESLKRAIPEGDDERRRKYQYYACLAGYEFEFGEAEEAIQGYIDEARKAGDENAEARFYDCLAQFQIAQSKWHPAIKTTTKTIELTQKINDLSLMAQNLATRCSIESLIGLYAESLVDCLRAKEIYESTGDKEATDIILFDIGIAYRRVGFNDKALEFFDELERYAEKNDLPLGKVQTSLQKSYVYQSKGLYEKALQLQQQAQQLAEEHNVYAENGSIHIAKADSYNQLKRFSEALNELDRAENFYARQGNSSQDEMIEYQKGLAFSGLEQAEKAFEHFEAAENLMRESGNERYLVWVYEARAKNYRQLGRNREAIETLNKHKELAEKLNAQKNEQQILVMRYQFDNERQKLENQRLLAEQQLRNKELESLKKAKQWQTVAIILGVILTLILVIFIVRQLLLSKRLKQLALTDSLTGTANRRHIEQYCEDAIKIAETTGSTVSIVVFDIDHFKQVNDQFGHRLGDQVLKRLTEYCTSALRNDDRLGRYGGEEFVIVLPKTELAQAYQVAERLRAGVETLEINSEGQQLSVTVSLGVAEYLAGETMPQLIERADNALYQAKAQGRNQTIRAE